MDELLQEFTASTILVLVAASTAIVKLITKGSDILYELMKMKLDFYRHKATFDEKIRQERESLRLEVDVKAQNHNNIPYIHEVLALSKILEEVLQKFNFVRATLLVFHNGTHEGFKNFSARYQEARSFTDYNINFYQNRPLSPFYKDMESYHVEEIIIYEGKEIKQKFFIQDYFVHKKIFCLVSIKDNSFAGKTIIKKQEEQGLYFPVAALVLACDSASMFQGTEEEFSFLKNRRDAIKELITNNPLILG